MAGREECPSCVIISTIFCGSFRHIHVLRFDVSLTVRAYGITRLYTFVQVHTYVRTYVCTCVHVVIP